MTGLGLAAGAARALGLGTTQKLADESALAEAFCCQSTAGIAVDPIASAVPGTRILESEGWRISNTDADPLVIKHVMINGERPAPVGCGSCGHVKRARGISYPLTISPDESVRIFGYAMGDYASYLEPVKYLVIETDRGNFHYSPGSGVEAE